VKHLPEPGGTIGAAVGIKAQIGGKRHPGTYGGKPSVIADNTLDRHRGTGQGLDGERQMVR
jgi:hypothetical protein